MFVTAGKPVVVEKPCCVSAKGAKRLAALAAEKRVFVMQGLWTRFLPAVRAARKLVLEDRAIGDVVSVHADFGFVSNDDAATSRACVARAAAAREKSSRLCRARARASRISSQNLRLSKNAAFSFSSSLASRRYVRELGGGSLLDIGIYPLSFCSLAYGGFSFLSMVLGEGRRRG